MIYGERWICIEGAMEKPENPEAAASSEACQYLEGELKPLCVAAFNNKSYSLEKSFELYFEN